MRRKDRDDDVDDNVHDEVYAHFFQQEKITMDCVSDGNDVSAENDAVLRGIAGRGGGGLADATNIECGHHYKGWC